VLAFLVVTAACGGGIRVSLQLQPGISRVTNEPVDTSSIRTLTITFANDAGESDQQTIVLDRTKQLKLAALTVDKTRPFTVDVWGCATLDSCELDEVAFRGCTPSPLDYSKLEGDVVLPIELLEATDTRLERCP
jgi:hypothetical protein